jgi:hypothetical protein
MRNLVSFLVWLPVVFTGFLSNANAGNSKPIATNLAGYWVSVVEPKDVIQIHSSRNIITQNQETRLYGFNMKAYSGLATSVWSDAAGAIDNPTLKFLENGDAQTVITNQIARIAENRTVSVNINIHLSSAESLFITHGVDKQAQTFERFVRLDQEEGSKRFIETSRERARELVRFYSDSSYKSQCKNLELAIENHDLFCAREFVTHKKITEQNLKAAAENFDYAMVKFFIARYEGTTDRIVNALLAADVPGARSVNGGKLFSLELDRQPIIELLTPKVSDVHTRIRLAQINPTSP